MVNDQEETIEFLARPESYGPGIDAVERIDTHASAVFLVGERVYKLKRAVRFSYLDYSSIELRRRACDREVTLNRRTAPDLYIGVVPVTRGPNGLELGGKGEVVEWLVEMARFEQAGLFDRMAAQGMLNERLMRDLADRIAEFHADAEVDRAAGGAAAAAKVIVGNDFNLRSVAGEAGLEKIDRLCAASRHALAQIATALDRRREEGHVRLCHGDLHLRNICLFHGRPTLFDCIEFSDELARIDVLYDLAFLIMDLLHRRLSGPANQVLNRYLDRRDEADGLAALPLFLSLRAAIRAHTGAVAAARQEDPAEAATLRGDVACYVDEALDFLAPAAPALLAVGGLSGTGKSTLAYALAPELGRAPGARVLRSDVLRKRLMGVAPETRLDPGGYRAKTTRRVYAGLRAAAAAAIASGQAVVADAVYLRKEERGAICRVARAAGVPFLGLWLEAPKEVLEGRIAARRGDASDATLRVLRMQSRQEAGRIEWRRLDASSGDPNLVLEQARQALAQALLEPGGTA